MEKDRSEAIMEYIAKLGIDIFIESCKIQGDALNNVVCIAVLLFDGIASSFENSGDGFTFEDMVEVLKKSHAITSGGINGKDSAEELLKRLNLN